MPTYAVTVLWGSATRIGIEAVPYLAPLLFQVGFGLSPFRSGLLLLATATGNLGMKLFTTPILRRFGFRAVATGLRAAREAPSAAARAEGAQACRARVFLKTAKTAYYAVFLLRIL